MFWKGQTIEGKSPVCERYEDRPGSRVPRGTWNLVGNREDHLSRLNTNWWPIVKQYREGKVKRTPGGEWNRTWNPMFTSSWRALKLDSVLFVERSGELLYVARLSTEGTEPKGNRVLIGRQVTCYRPETGWSTHGQVEAGVKSRGGPNHVTVEKVWDELWMAEKFQSNSEIAGSPRNSFRASLRYV